MGYNTQFDVLAPDDLTGEITVVKVLDADNTPNRVLQLGKSWSINVEWKLTDDPGNFIVASLRGTWEVRAKLESMGAGFEGQVGATSIVPLNGGTNYNTTIQVNNKPDPADPQNEGAFKLVVLINFKNPAGQPQPMAGFYEGPMIQFYKPF